MSRKYSIGLLIGVSVIVGLFVFISFSYSVKNTKPVILYVTNHGAERFDNALITIDINNKRVFADSVKNQYLSFYWEKQNLSVSEDEFDLSTHVNVNGYDIWKDTTVSFNGKDSVQIFVRFEFTPYYKRYTNPDIYSFIESEIDNYTFTKMADSLYRIGALVNADKYLDDTIPLSNSLKMTIK